MEARNGFSARRRAHSVFEDPAFCNELNGRLEVFVERAQANWNEMHCIATATEILLKALSLSTSSKAQERTLRIIDKICSVCLKWMKHLIIRITDSKDDLEIITVQHKLVYIACVCRLTFDRDAKNVCQGLDPDASITCYVNCAIIIRDNCPKVTSTLPLFMSRALLRDNLIAHRLHPPVLEALKDLMALYG